MSRYNLLVFDWDGTLSDSAALIVRSIQRSAEDLSLAVPTDAQASYVIGLGLIDAMKHLFPGLEAVAYPKVAERYKAHWMAGYRDVVLFPGVESGLRQLKDRGFQLAVATGKSRKGLDTALDQTGLRPLFDLSRCADEGMPKPHPDMLFYLLDATGAAPAEALMIGDTTHDLDMATAAGVDGLAVCYGAHPAEQLEASQRVHCIDTPAGLWTWLNENA